MHKAISYMSEIFHNSIFKNQITSSVLKVFQWLFIVLRIENQNANTTYKVLNNLAFDYHSSLNTPP